MAKIKSEVAVAYGNVYAQLSECLSTMQALAKKPNDPVNKFKLKHVNELLGRVNQILGPAYRPFKDFELFEVEGEIVTTSDVVMILSQYVARMKKFRADHTVDIMDEDYPNMDVVKESRWNTID